MAVFLCLDSKNPVCSVSHRLGSFRRISLFASVLFHKKDEKRDGEMETVIWPPSSFGPFWKRTTATPLTNSLIGDEKTAAKSRRLDSRIAPLLWQMKRMSPKAQVYGGDRGRTCDLLHAMQALSQLSYTPWALIETSLEGWVKNIKRIGIRLYCVSVRAMSRNWAKPYRGGFLGMDCYLLVVALPASSRRAMALLGRFALLKGCDILATPRGGVPE